MVCWSVSQIIGCVGVFTCSVGLFYNVPINLFYFFYFFFKIKKVALDDEAIEKFRGQYDP